MATLDRNSTEVKIEDTANDQDPSSSRRPGRDAFQPPLPHIRHGDDGRPSSGQFMTPTVPGNGPMKDSYSRGYSSGDHHGRFPKHSSPYPPNSIVDKSYPTHRKSGGSPFVSDLGGSFDPYTRQDDTRHPSESRHAPRGSAFNHHGTGHSGSHGKYAYHRDGPSPGRSYSGGRNDDIRTHGTSLDQSIPPFNPPYPPNTADPISDAGQPTSGQYDPTMFRSSSKGQAGSRKRQAADPSTPDGPRLISNQSSDDSLNAFLPREKRVRTGTSLSADSAMLMKSFTPLSPMQSRSFSRDDTLDMSRFTSRGSGENYRIFHSWSSGNSNSGAHSPSDVRVCYDDWKSGVGSRKASWDEKAQPPMNGPERSRQASYGTISSNGNPYPPPTKVSRRGSTSQRWPSPSPRMNPNPTDKNPSQNAPQPLHPEDRCGPYQNQLAHHIQSQPYRGEQDDWYRRGGERQMHPSQQYGPQRRDDIEDRSKMQPMSRGPRQHSTSRLSAMTPPVTNGYGRYNTDYYPGIYDPPPPLRGSRGYDNKWGRPQMPPPPYMGMPSYEGSRESFDSYGGMGQQRLSHLKGVKVESGLDGAVAMRTSKDILLLSLPEDRISLSETLCTVRENIEVFAATEADVKAPAPGRKRPVVEGQVGLRCIHCRAALHQSDKVKRAVCFPSSIKRIYRTVIDMKLDHFKSCKFVPMELKMKLEELKATNARSTGTTMQYFLSASKRMGMIDTAQGIRLEKPNTDGTSDTTKDQNKETKEKDNDALDASKADDTTAPTLASSDPSSQSTKTANSLSFSLSTGSSISGESLENAPSQAIVAKDKPGTVYFAGKTVLSLPEDLQALSPLRCFLRQNVCAFSATAEDIAVRTPTTFSVIQGQVGIGCIHCLSLPAKERSNRAVCFPFSIGRIYQSVADIQRFHLGECKMVPDAVRKKFLELQNASSKGSKGLATRQYWVTSAKKLGLVDSESGIRFTRDPTIPIEKAVSLDILAQVASDVTTAAKPLVLPDDEPHIAGFLFEVMKQLQPCRFTEADRNKRRLKDVGCIGVECKHCSGQVDGRKFFWSSVNAVESNFVSVHTHMMECKMIPDEYKAKLAHLKSLRKEQTSKLKSGSQKAFFSRVWKRLHAEGNKVPSGTNLKKDEASPPPNVAEPMCLPGKVNTSTDLDVNMSKESPLEGSLLSLGNRSMSISIDLDTTLPPIQPMTPISATLRKLSAGSLGLDDNTSPPVNDSNSSPTEAQEHLEKGMTDKLDVAVDSNKNSEQPSADTSPHRSQPALPVNDTADMNLSEIQSFSSSGNERSNASPSMVDSAFDTRDMDTDIVDYAINYQERDGNDESKAAV